MVKHFLLLLEITKHAKMARHQVGIEQLGGKVACKQLLEQVIPKLQ